MKYKHIALIVLICGCLFLQLSSAQVLPPVTPQFADSVVIHNRVIYDNYSWLRDRNNPQVKKYLKKEQHYASALFMPSQPIADTVYTEFLSRLNEAETSQPFFEHGYFYYTRTEKGKAFTIHCRKKGSLSAKEEIFLDENKLAKGKSFFSIGTFDVSPDQNLLAYSVDYSGYEVYRLCIKYLSTGKTITSPHDNISEALWMADNKTLIFTTLNERMQTDKAWRWNINSPKPELLYEETDPAWDISIYHGCDETMIFLSTSSKDASEVHYLKSNDTSGKFVCLLKRQNKHIYNPDYYDGKFYILTNQYQSDNDLVVCEAGKTDIADWKVLYPGKDKNPISGFSVFDSHIVLVQRNKGFKNLVIINRNSGTFTDSIVPDEPMDLHLWVNPDPKAEIFYYTVEDEITPYAIYSYDFASKDTEIIRRYPPAGIYDKNQYTTKLKWVTASDGTLIPLRLTYLSSLDDDNNEAAHIVKLSAYGAYGDCEDPYFRSSALSYLDRGIILATAHIRGGGEFGQSWYDDGRLLNKKNSFTDFIACMDYLIDNGITTPEKLIIEGGSAGGLLMGAVTNLAWDKCALVIADVPFVDLIMTMLDDSLPLTIQEYEEWGNPNVEEYFNYMLSYSPVNNIIPHPYPTMLITTALNDTRVGYWEAAKWTARLRAYNTGNNPIILRINNDEGHTGQVDRYKSLKSYSETVGYVLWLIENNY